MTTPETVPFRIKAVEAALEWSKQITGLATGTVVLSGTFIKDIFSGEVRWMCVIIACWTMMVLSAVFGVFYLGAMTSSLNRATKVDDIDVYGPRMTAVLQGITFFAGLVAFIIFVGVNQ